MERASAWLKNVLTPNQLLHQLAYVATSHFAQIAALHALASVWQFRLPFFTLAFYSGPAFVAAIMVSVYRKAKSE
jgi:hypothetical protein